MTNWVRMEHNDTNGDTLVSEKSVPNYEKRGWTVAKADKPSAISEKKPKPVRDPKVKEVPADDGTGEVKENA